MRERSRERASVFCKYVGFLEDGLGDIVIYVVEGSWILGYVGRGRGFEFMIPSFEALEMYIYDVMMVVLLGFRVGFLILMAAWLVVVVGLLGFRLLSFSYCHRKHNLVGDE